MIDLDTKKLAICFITKGRPDWVEKLLSSLLIQQVENIPAPQVDIICVDNDPDGSARETVEAASKKITSNQLINAIHYHIQPEPGIPFARNMALDVAAKDYDYIGFVDDDEICPAGWLEALLTRLAETNAMVVHGPVYPIFETNPAPDWINKGGYYTKDSHADGQDTLSAATNNVIFDTKLITEHGLRFNEAMRHTGGTDHLFFMQAKQQGAKLIWVKNAVINEFIPANRMQERWIRKRYIRQGNTHALCALHVNPGIKTKLKLLAGGGTRVAIGLVKYALHSWRGPVPRLAACHYLHRGWGMLSVLFGRVYQEYNQPT